MTTLSIETLETAKTAKTAEAAAQTATVELRVDGAWIGVCELGLLTPGRGAAALLPDGRQVAVFRDRGGALHAISNQDPFTGAYVLSRGLLGSAAGRPYVASPLLKQRFDLATGQCLDDENVAVPAYRTRIRTHIRQG